MGVGRPRHCRHKYPLASCSRRQGSKEPAPGCWPPVSHPGPRAPRTTLPGPAGWLRTRDLDPQGPQGSPSTIRDPGPAAVSLGRGCSGALPPQGRRESLLGSWSGWCPHWPQRSSCSSLPPSTDAFTQPWAEVTGRALAGTLGGLARRPTWRGRCRPGEGGLSRLPQRGWGWGAQDRTERCAPVHGPPVWTEPCPRPRPG